MRMPSNSTAFFPKFPASPCSSTFSRSASSRAASRMAVGNTSLVDWAMLTWSLGLTRAYSPSFPPRISTARFASTSFTFMLWEVPAPAWNGSTTNWSANLPASASSAACTMALATSAPSRPVARFACAAHFLILTVARTSAWCGLSPEMGKLSTALWVCAP